MRRRCVKTGQWQIRHHARGRSASVDQHLVGAFKNAFHRLDIKTACRDFLRNLVGLIDRVETRGIALGLQHDLGAIGLRFLRQARRITMGARHHVITIGFGFVDQTLQIDLRTLHIAERVDDLARRIDFLQLDLGDLDAGAVGIENALQQLLRIDFDLAAAFGERAGDFGAADDFAHRAFRRRLYRLCRVADVEDEGPRILHQPEDGEIDIDDVFIAGEHQ